MLSKVNQVLAPLPYWTTSRIHRSTYVVIASLPRNWLCIYHLNLLPSLNPIGQFLVISRWCWPHGPLHHLQQMSRPCFDISNTVSKQPRTSRQSDIALYHHWYPWAVGLPFHLKCTTLTKVGELQCLVSANPRFVSHRKFFSFLLGRSIGWDSMVSE